MKSILNKVTSLTLLAVMGTFMSCGNNNPTQGSKSVIKSIQNETSGNYLVATQFGDTEIKTFGDGNLLKKFEIKKNLWIVNEFNNSGIELELITEEPISDYKLLEALQVVPNNKSFAIASSAFAGGILGAASAVNTLGKNLGTTDKGYIVLAGGFALGMLSAGYASAKVILNSEGETNYSAFKAINPMNEILVRQQRVNAIISNEKDVGITQQKYKLVKERLQAAGKSRNK